MSAHKKDQYHLLVRNKDIRSACEKIENITVYCAKNRREKNPLLPGETRESRDITLTPGILTNNPHTSRSPSSALFILLEVPS